MGLAVTKGSSTLTFRKHLAQDKHKIKFLYAKMEKQTQKYHQIFKFSRAIDNRIRTKWMRHTLTPWLTRFYYILNFFSAYISDLGTLFSIHSASALNFHIFYYLTVVFIPYAQKLCTIISSSCSCKRRREERKARIICTIHLLLMPMYALCFHNSERKSTIFQIIMTSKTFV